MSCAASCMIPASVLTTIRQNEASEPWPSIATLPSSKGASRAPRGSVTCWHYEKLPSSTASRACPSGSTPCTELSTSTRSAAFGRHALRDSKTASRCTFVSRPSRRSLLPPLTGRRGCRGTTSARCHRQSAARRSETLTSQHALGTPAQAGAPLRVAPKVCNCFNEINEITLWVSYESSSEWMIIFTLHFGNHYARLKIPRKISF